MSPSDSYRLCREVSRRAGSTFFWATQLLPRAKRPHVHALYAFARHADDLVDHPGGDPGADLATFRERFFVDLDRGHSDDPLLLAVVHTARAYEIERPAFDRFLSSMEMDLTVASYESWDDLLGYMDGSAAVIGEMMLPILGPDDLAAAAPPARALGLAFQLTNFLRDVDEDLDRGRQYLPQEDLRRFGVELTDRQASPEFVELMRFEIGRARELYADASAGVGMLGGRSRRCISAAHSVYSRILDRIEDQGCDVFVRRASVSTTRKLTIVGRELVRPAS